MFDAMDPLREQNVFALGSLQENGSQQVEKMDAMDVTFLGAPERTGRGPAAIQRRGYRLQLQRGYCGIRAYDRRGTLGYARRRRAFLPRANLRALALHAR